MNQQLINKYDSDFCGSLPIHLINVVQPYGALMVIEKISGNVIQVSENMEALTGRAFREIPETHASDYIDTKRLPLVKDNAPQVWEISGKKYLAILHNKTLYYILEINLESTEEALSGSFINVYQELKQAITAIEQTSSLSDAASVAAKELKKASGFDKVMVYRFDEHWNGFVIAEEQEADMESYFGFTFPASDIPKQARELYLKNTYRFIPDREYTPVKLYPFINPATDTFMDMSDCNVRGVTTVHLEYLKNMKVTASMSTRIIKDGKLWGLIACHHKTAMTMNYKMCSVFELLSGIISTKISSLENVERYSFNEHLSAIYKTIVEEIYSSGNIARSLLYSANNLLKLFSATGAIIATGGQINKAGTVPDDIALEDLLLFLNARESDNVYSSGNLSGEFEYARDYRDTGSGILVMPVNREDDQYIVVFRPEVIQVINWGGDPEGRINFEQDLKTYHPRFSFKLWQEKVRGISSPWRQEEIDVAVSLTHFIRDFLKKKKYKLTV